MAKSRETFNWNVSRIPADERRAKKKRAPLRWESASRPDKSIRNAEESDRFLLLSSPEINNRLNGVETNASRKTPVITVYTLRFPLLNAPVSRFNTTYSDT